MKSGCGKSRAPGVLPADVFRQFLLGAMERGIGSVQLEQFVVRAEFDQAAAFDDHDPVGLAERAEAVGDRDCRAAFHEVL